MEKTERIGKLKEGRVIGIIIPVEEEKIGDQSKTKDKGAKKGS